MSVIRGVLGIEVGLHQAEDGGLVGLLVGAERLSLLRGLEVDAESGHSQQRLLDVDQSPVEAALLVLHNHTSGQSQVSVKPSVPQSSTVTLDTNLRNILSSRISTRYQCQFGELGIYKRF